ncbi:DUF1571 domain-containing protein [Bacteroidota bacterium]
MRIGLFLLLFYLFAKIAVSQSGNELLDKMSQAIDSIQSIEFILISNERFGEEYRKDEGYIKVKYSPYSVYYKQIIPDQGVEIFYSEGENEGKARLKLNKFPYLTMNLFPIQMQMRKNRHHTIFETGVMKYMAATTLNLVNKNANSVEIKYLGLFKVNDMLCNKITIYNPEFKLIEYVVQENETIIDIAKKYHICDYMIVDLNDNVNGFEDLYPGKNIHVPSEYAKSIEFSIDKKSNLPVLIRIYDDIGLFEQYYFKNLKVNQL